MAAKRATWAASHVSSLSERTLLTCVPMARWQPAHSRQSGTQRLSEPHSGAAAPQSAHIMPEPISLSSAATREGECMPPCGGAAPKAAATAALIASAHACIVSSESACRWTWSLGERSSR